jgi:uncharacterized protein YgiM (DUF1202 family)
VALTVSAPGDAAAPWSAKSTTYCSGGGTARYADAPAAIAPDVMQVAYLAASTTSAESTASARVRCKEASRHAARAIRNDTAPKLKGSASETLRPILRLKVTRSSYATPDLNVRTEAKEESSVDCVVPADRKLSIAATVTNGFQCESYQGKGPWRLTQQLVHSGD